MIPTTAGGFTTSKPLLVDVLDDGLWTSMESLQSIIQCINNHRAHTSTPHHPEGYMHKPYLQIICFPTSFVPVFINRTGILHYRQHLYRYYLHRLSSMIQTTAGGFTTSKPLLVDVLDDGLWTLMESPQAIIECINNHRTYSRTSKLAAPAPISFTPKDIYSLTYRSFVTDILH